MIQGQVWDRLAQRSCDPPDEATWGRHLAQSGATGPDHLGMYHGVAVDKWPPGAAPIRLPRLSESEQRSLDSALRALSFLVDRADADTASLVALHEIPIDPDDPVIAETELRRRGVGRALREPESRLDRLPELVHMNRGGRVTRRTLARLGAHTEDWATRLPQGPHPRRLVLERVTTDHDIHENRVLIDSMIMLRRYALDLAQTVEDATALNAEARGLETVTHQVRVRVAAIIGSGDDLDTNHETLVSLRSRIDDVIALTERASRGTLATDLGWRRFAEPIEDTNLFRSHPDYRDVRRLAVALRSCEADLPPEVALASTRRLARLFDKYVAHASAQATRLLAPPAGSRLPGAPSWGAGNAGIRSQPDGTVVVESAGRRVRLVPMPFPGAHVLHEVESSLSDLEERTVVVALGRPAAHVLLPGGMVSVVTMGPFTLLGLEKLAAAIRWHIDAQELLEYPRQVMIPLDVRDALARASRAHVSLVEQEREVQIASCGAAPAELERHLLDELEVMRATDARQHLLKRRQGDSRPQAVVLQPILDALSWTWSLRTCPSCGWQTAHDSWIAQPQATFRAECSSRSCRARWYVSRCHLGHRYASIRMPQQELDAGADAWAPGEGCPLC